MHHHPEGYSFKDFVMGLLIGTTIGGASVFLAGTKQGQKLQREVLAKCDQLKNEAKKEVKKAARKTVRKKRR